MDVNLIIFKPQGGQKSVSLHRGTYTIGRQEGVTIQIPLPGVSREHCEIKVSSEQITVRDLGSSNGTFKNHERVTEAELGAGDYLGVGEIVMGVQVNGEPAQVKPPQVAAKERGGAAEADSGSDSSMMDIASDDDDGADHMSDMVDDGTRSSMLSGMGMDDSDGLDLDLDLDDSDAPSL